MTTKEMVRAIRDLRADVDRLLQTLNPAPVPVAEPPAPATSEPSPTG